MPRVELTVVRDFGAEDGQALLPVRSTTTEGVQGGGALALPLAHYELLISTPLERSMKPKMVTGPASFVELT
jgi:hypothetical protein